MAPLYNNYTLIGGENYMENFILPLEQFISAKQDKLERFDLQYYST